MSPNFTSDEFTNECEHPSKRLKTTSSTSHSNSHEQYQHQHQQQSLGMRLTGHAQDENLREANFGITEFVDREGKGFTGILKKRYTDFLVNEITLEGDVLHLAKVEGLVKPKPAKVQGGSGKQGDGDVNATTAGEARGQDVVDTPIKQRDEAGPEQVWPTIEESMKEPRRLPPHLRTEELKLQGQVAAESRPAVVEETRRIREKIHLRVTPDGCEDISEDEFKAARLAREEEANSGAINQAPLAIEVQPKNGIDGGSAANDQPDDGSDGGAELNDKPQAQANEIELNDKTQAQENGLAGWNTLSGRDQPVQVTPADKEILSAYFTPRQLYDLLALYARVLESPGRGPQSYGRVQSEPVERAIRKIVHQHLRDIFAGKLESWAGQDSCIVVEASQPTKQKPRGRNATKSGEKQQENSQPTFKDLGGQYLHFTMYKKNRETMEVVHQLEKLLHLRSRSFQIAGTKDRRAVTTQRISVERILPKRMVNVAKMLRYVYIGDFEYRPTGLRLGDLSGNEFVITLRDCSFNGVVDPAEQYNILTAAVSSISNQGFLNYYGLQRFGSFSVSTDEVGMHMLKGDFDKAVACILDYNPACLEPKDEDDGKTDISEDDRARAEAIFYWNSTGDAATAVPMLPKRARTEATMMRHLSQPTSKNDFQGALGIIPRNMRLMYVHAYQSLVWNHAASERWRVYGALVVEGDLILTKPKEQDDQQVGSDEDQFARARPLTASEASSGQYTIFDVVLPTPGFDIEYPRNQIGVFYKTFMANDHRGGGLDPDNMRRAWKDISLPGSYRVLLARPRQGKVSYDLRTYSQEDEQLVQTDMDKYFDAHPDLAPQPHTAPPQAHNEEQQPKPPPSPAPFHSGEQRKTAVVLTLQLGSSQYATMALRELMKRGGVKMWKSEFAGGRGLL